jgi:hypothetical protein
MMELLKIITLFIAKTTYTSGGLTAAGTLP